MPDSDVWGQAVDQIKNAVLAEEPETALVAALGMAANFGRVLSLISDDMDRIATILEKTFTQIDGQPAEDPAASLVGHPDEPEPVETGQAIPLDL